MDLQNRDIPTAELISLDCHYFQSWPKHELTIVGCDISQPAVEYARAVGLLDDGITQNLEQEPLNQASKDALQGVDLIISTGAIGYVTERSLSRLLRAIGEPAPWLASFVLRLFPYDTISSLLDEHGHVTEKLSGVTFVQRRFQSEHEFHSVLKRLEALDIDSRVRRWTACFTRALSLTAAGGLRRTPPLKDLPPGARGYAFPMGHDSGWETITLFAYRLEGGRRQ